ncbi:GntR family transcriptional regulator [Arthrobacter sp. NPDC056727]|uniref:GntR family transcriptional regulator n=1 Tax=Arthrobacter sp. NPDC056727 TaxID=3345927 RepID=UPI0036728352
MRTQLPESVLYPGQRSGPLPLYYELAVRVETAVECGTLKGGAELPPEVEVARQLKVSRNTVRNAWAYLEKKGLVIRRQGSGTIVC